MCKSFQESLARKSQKFSLLGVPNEDLLTFFPRQALLQLTNSCPKVQILAMAEKNQACKQNLFESMIFL